MAKSTKKDSNGANLGFEAKLWQAADKLRSNMDAIEKDNKRLKNILPKNYAQFTESARLEKEIKANLAKLALGTRIEGTNQQRAKEQKSFWQNSHHSAKPAPPLRHPGNDSGSRT